MSGVLGLPKMAERMVYSRLAASEPKEKLESKVKLNIGSFGANGSATCMLVINAGEVR